MWKLVNYPDPSQIIYIVQLNRIILEVKRHFPSNSELFILDLISSDSAPNFYFFTSPDGEGGRNRENKI